VARAAMKTSATPLASASVARRMVVVKALLLPVRRAVCPAVRHALDAAHPSKVNRLGDHNFDGPSMNYMPIGRCECVLALGELSLGRQPWRRTQLFCSEVDIDPIRSLMIIGTAHRT
jgi:hypothetical protein